MHLVNLMQMYALNKYLKGTNKYLKEMIDKKIFHLKFNLIV